ncbi:restriction endonuclease [Arcobacter sp. YIC-310]|uniref:nSTAND1 domain-containing NTPase n=1 Tax=Arcobacter sp. YIC-310 TaxID=3376632 RepID=UPI003C154983
MIEEIAIIFSEENNSKKGNYFEDLVGNIFVNQRFNIDAKNMNITGQEFDLVCSHKDINTNEQILIECKAKESISSAELNLFNFKVLDNEYSKGIFIYSKDFGHQVQGTIDKWKNGNKYNNLSFWNGKKVIELLVESNQIKKYSFNSENFQITKVILFFSYDGFYYIPFFSNTTLPKYFSVINAKTLESITNPNTIEVVQKHIKETKQLDHYQLDSKTESTLKNNPIEIESIAEVKESESWYDYKPASLEYFVGRDKFTKKIMDVLKDIIDKKTEHRVFYIDGKSGWGKSSLLVALRGKLRNKHYKNKYYGYVVDSRSANSQSFISLAFTTMLNKASNEKFIPENLSNIQIPSYFDIMNSQGIEELKKYLEDNNKLLILIFDQFEDIFRKESILQSFFKLLTDVNMEQSNIVLGFSWKNETFISADEKEVSRLLSQSREHSVSITMSEFTTNECKKIIEQLETDINEKLDIQFINRIIDNSQGFPWLVKKLCVHIYKQVSDGISLVDLFSQDLNVESLFTKDLEQCNEDEIRALRIIAQRAYESNMFDTTEVNELVSQDVITSLTNKNLIIKTGAKYNIYWDIFRDYLVTDNVPKVGETYIIRTQPNSAYEVLSYFDSQKEMTLDEISLLTNNSKSTLENQLRELRGFNIIEYDSEKYKLKDENFDLSEENFKAFMKNKLEKHTFYMELLKIKDKQIDLSELVEIITDKVNTGSSYSQKTLSDYAQLFLNWLNYVELSIGNINPELLRKTRNENTFTPQEKPNRVLEFFDNLSDEQQFTKEQNKFLYDLKALGLITYKNHKVRLTSLGNEAKNDRLIIYRNALKAHKINYSFSKLCTEPNIKARNFKDIIPDLIDESQHKTYASSTARKLYDWAKLIYDNKDDLGLEVE